jgi:hypothetical protein
VGALILVDEFQYFFLAFGKHGYRAIANQVIAEGAIDKPFRFWIWDF